MPQSMIDQWEKVISWTITFLVSAVMFLVGWIFNHILKSIDQRFLSVMQIMQDRLDRQDVMINDVIHSLSRLHRRDDFDSSEEERVPPRRGREQRRVEESREDQERSSD